MRCALKLILFYDKKLEKLEYESEKKQEREKEEWQGREESYITIACLCWGQPVHPLSPTLLTYIQLTSVKLIYFYISLKL